MSSAFVRTQLERALERLAASPAEQVTMLTARGFAHAPTSWRWSSMTSPSWCLPPFTTGTLGGASVFDSTRPCDAWFAQRWGPRMALGRGPTRLSLAVEWGASAGTGSASSAS